MTILIGIHCGNQIKLIADTRVSSYNSSKTKDGISKIITFKNGMITGTGDNILLERVKSRVLFDKKKTIDSILEIIKSTQKEVQEDVDSYNKRKRNTDARSGKDIIENTSFLIAINDSETLYLCHIENKNKKNNIKYITNGETIVTHPLGIDFNIYKLLSKDYIENAPSKISNDLLTELTKKFMTKLSLHTDSISVNYYLKTLNQKGLIKIKYIN